MLLGYLPTQRPCPIEVEVEVEVEVEWLTSKTKSKVASRARNTPPLITRTSLPLRV